MAKRPDVAKRLIAAHIDATLLVRNDPAKAAQIINDQIKKESGGSLNPEVLKRAMTRVEFSWDPVASSLFSSAKAAFSVGFLKSEPKLDGLYSLDILNSILKDRALPAVGAE